MKFVPITGTPPKHGESYLLHRNGTYRVLYVRGLPNGNTYGDVENYLTAIWRNGDVVFHGTRVEGWKICMTPLSAEEEDPAVNPNQMDLPFVEEA